STGPNSATTSRSSNISTATAGTGWGRRTRPGGPGWSPCCCFWSARAWPARRSTRRRRFRRRRRAPAPGRRNRPAVLAIDGAVCRDLAAAERREWWLANGRGGYAGGTLALSLTRRYHGLLVPPLGRVLVLAKADATLHADGADYPLFTNRWGSGAIVPEGYRLIDGFALDGSVPVWRFRCGGRVVEHRIWLEPGADTVCLAWRLVEGGPARLSVTLLANGRDHHGDTWPDGFRPAVAADGARLSVAAANRFTLAIVATAGEMAPGGEWYWDFDLPVERERGLGDRDAHLHVGDARLDLIPGEWAGLAASLAPNPDPDLAAALARRQAADRAVSAARAISRRRRTGCGGWRWPATSISSPARSPICRTAGRSSPAIPGSATGAATR